MTKFLNLLDPALLLQPWDPLSPADICDSESRGDGSSVPVAPDAYRMPATSLFSTAAVAFRSIASLPRNASLGSLPATLEAANKPIITEAIAGKAVAKKVLSRGIPYAWAPQVGFEAGQFLRETLGIERTWGDLYDELFHTIDADDFENLEPESSEGSGWFDQVERPEVQIDGGGRDYGDSRRWDIRTVAPVTVKDAVAATRDADIILGHWFPPREAQYHPPSWLPTEILDFFPDHDPDEMIAVDFGFDSGIVKIIQADPKKTLVYTGQLGGLTGSMMFEKRLERMQSLKPEGLNNFKHTHSNAAGENPTPLSRMNFYDNWSSGNAQTQVTVHRSTQAPPIPEFKTGETVNAPALPRSFFSTVEEWVRGFLS